MSLCMIYYNNQKIVINKTAKNLNNFEQFDFSITFDHIICHYYVTSTIECNFNLTYFNVFNLQGRILNGIKNFKIKLAITENQQQQKYIFFSTLKESKIKFFLY